jgi:integrase/recombinase XerD
MKEQFIFSNFASQFLEERKARGKAPKTILFYSMELKYFQVWLAEKNQSLDSIELLSPPLIRQYFIDLGTHRNKGGVVGSYRAIRAFFNWYDSEYEPVWKNPIRKVKIANNSIAPLAEIPLDDIQKLVDKCSGKNELRDIAILKTLVDTGARATELISLNLADVNLTTGQVNILHGKGNKFRVVWLGEKSLKILKEYLKQREELKPDAPLFLNEDGNRLLFYGLRMVIFRLCNRSGVENKGLHCFRRTCALTLYRKTHDILFVSRYLGHSNIEVTKRYLNINNEDLKDQFKSCSPADLLN